MKNEEVIKIMESITESVETNIKQSHDDMGKLIDLHQRLIAAELGAVSDVIKIKFDKVYEKQDKTNGGLIEHDKRLKELEDVIKPQNWVKKHWKAAALLFLVSTYALYVVYELYSLADIIKAVK